MSDGCWHAECERLCEKCAATYAKEGDECGTAESDEDIVIETASPSPIKIEPGARLKGDDTRPNNVLRF